MSPAQPFYSIVIPTYNEQAEIEATLSCCSALEGDFEVIVVDDSTDRTAEIISNFKDHRIRLIRPEVRGGRCEARNRGIEESTGEVVVILNADVHLAPDFLARLDEHYASGADYVLVSAIVENSNCLLARYVDCAELLQPYSARPELMDWTEGFSVRKNVAIQAGLFPTGFPVRIVAGEDGFFGQSLRKLSAVRVYDPSIVVAHVSPSELSEFWAVRRGRGEGIPQVRHYLQGWSLRRILLRDATSSCLDVMRVITLVPLMYTSWRMTARSDQGLRDLLPFCGVWVVERMAIHIGVWQSVLKIRRVERNSGR